MAEAPAQPPGNRATRAPADPARVPDVVTAPTAGEPEEPATPEWERLSVEERAVLLKVAEILQRIQFGTVVLSVQDGKVVQIEMAEKFRLR
jgi:hypothetical protein